ncbi:hypothetical protein Tco_0321278 [Tanacetum coccineum]
METSIISDIHLEDAGGNDCLLTATIFEELAKMGAKSTAWNEFSSTMASLIICLATNQKFNMSKYIFDAMVKHLDGGVKFLMYLRFLQVFINQQLGDMSHHKKIYVNPSHTKKILANMKREGNDFSGRIIPLFATMMVQRSRRKQRKEVEGPQDDTQHEENIPTPSNDQLPSGEDRMQLTDLMVLCTKLQKQVLNLEKAKSDQAIEIASLKKRVEKLERRRKFRTTRLQRLKKVGTARRIGSSNDSLGAQEDASKQGRIIKDLDADDVVTLINETQERQNEDLMFDAGVLDGDEMFVDVTTGEKEEQSTKIDDMKVSTADPVTTAGEAVTTAGKVVTTAGVEDSVAPTIPVSSATTVDETLAQTLMEIKAAKPKSITIAANTRPKAKGIVFHDQEKQVSMSEPTVSITQPSIKDKGKGIMQEPERPLKKKDQVVLDEDLARNLQAQLEAELIEEERLVRKKEEEANIALIESWDNTQAMMETDFELAQWLQTEEQEEITIEERSRLFVELMNKRKKHFAMLRAEEKRRKPPTKAQKRNLMSTYLKNMGGYKHNQLKSKSYEEIQKLFDNEMRRVNTFIPMDSEEVKRKKGIEESSKGTEDELRSDKSKKAESSEEKAKGSRKKILGKKRAGKEQQQESSKRQRIEDDKETNEHEEVEVDDEAEIKTFEGIMKLVKTKHGDSRPEDEHERVLWGELKVMFEPDIKSDVWRNLQGYKVTIWKLFDSCGVHFVRYANGTSTTLIRGLVTTEEKVQKKNDVKARSMLLMALPNEHLMTFNQYKDAQTLFAAIQIRFSGNEATTKTQKTLLNQMYENFSAPTTESLDSIFNRLQKIVSQMAILGENISQDDLNLKFLISLPSKWNTHVVVWRNKPDLDTMSFDDLYNNFKVVKQEGKRTASSRSQNMDFMSSTNSTNEVNTAYGVSTANTQVSPASTQVSTASTQVSTANLSDDTIYVFLASQPNGSQLVYEDLEQIHEDDIKEMDLKWQLALLSMRTTRFFQKTGRKITINGSDIAGYDKSKVECFNYHKMGYFARECRGPRNQDSRNRNQDSSKRTVNVEETSSKAMVAIDGAGFDWSYMADDEVPTNMALMAFQTLWYIMIKLFEGYGPKTSKNVGEDTSNEVRESPDALMVEKLVSDDKLEKKTVFPTVAKIEFVRPKQ